MMKKLQTGLLMGMIFLCANTFGQITEPGSEKIRDGKTTETHLDLLLNLVSSNFNYGKSNSVLTDYRKPVQGIQAGLSFQAGITPKFSLVSELYYMKKGGTLKANNPLTTNKTTLSLYTLELPLLARFHFGKFYLNAGPSIAYNLSGTRKTEDLSDAHAIKSSNEAFKRWDAGIQAGGGYVFQINQKQVALDIRYVYGLTNISYGQEMYNRSIVISVHCSAPWKSNPIGKK